MPPSPIDDGLARPDRERRDDRQRAGRRCRRRSRAARGRASSEGCDRPDAGDEQERQQAHRVGPSVSGVERVRVGLAARAAPRPSRLNANPPVPSAAGAPRRASPRAPASDRPASRAVMSCSSSPGVPPRAGPDEQRRHRSGAASRVPTRRTSRPVSDRGDRQGRDREPGRAGQRRAQRPGRPRPWAAKPTTSGRRGEQDLGRPADARPAGRRGAVPPRGRSRATTHSRYAARIAPTNRAARPERGGQRVGQRTASRRGPRRARGASVRASRAATATTAPATTASAIPARSGFTAGSRTGSWRGGVRSG